jgi:hypothetical protein
MRNFSAPQSLESPRNGETIAISRGWDGAPPMASGEAAPPIRESSREFPAQNALFTTPPSARSAAPVVAEASGLAR